MVPTLLATAVAALVRSLAALWLQRWNIGAPAFMVLAGFLLGLDTGDTVESALNTHVAQHVCEIVLAFLLFIDATEIRGGRLWGTSPRLVARVLLVAMPLSLGAAMLLGAWLFPHLPWAVLLIIACVVVPIDFAPAEHLVRDQRLSARVRSVLNIEGGYNDGIISPVFLFALLLAGSASGVSTPVEALATALTQAGVAIAVGLALGAVMAWALDRAGRAGWMTDQSRRIAVVLTPVVTYCAAVQLRGNGFVASFVCGIAFRYLHRVLTARAIRSIPRLPPAQPPAQPPARASTVLTHDFGLIEDVTALMTLTMWFVVGIATVVTPELGLSWQAALFCLGALTLVRVLPVLGSLTASPLPRADRVLLSLLGPRGTTSIVFGLIAYNQLPTGPGADTGLLTTVLCVLGSVLLHGMGSDTVIRRLAPTPR
ncbi:cation:proton antiporter [Streptomyces xanthochromogenes]|uniref:cation:proton antiporter n=1 Tax=Streptomyces xanthochromogenes TaxID=67384 RepID=UPI003435B01B